MNLSHIIKTAERFTQDNSPAILTGIGVVGTISTAYLAGKASFKAARDLDEHANVHDWYHKGDSLPTFREKAKVVWKLYIPAASSGVLTVASIITANQIGNRRTAAMAAAYTITDKAFTEYREKVVHKFGENKERAARDELAQDRVRNMGSSGIVMVGEGNVLCFDQFSGRYFQSTLETIRSAINWVNYQAQHSGYCSLGDFYNRLELSGTKYSEEVGWLPEHFVELNYTTTLTDEMKPCLAIDFSVAPVRHYYKFGG